MLRGAVLGEMILVIGIIVISLIFFLAFQKTITRQVGITKAMSTKQIGERIASLMKRIDSEPSQTSYEISIPRSTLEVKNNFLTVKRNEDVFTLSVPENSIDVLLEDVSKVCIYKEEKKIELLEECP